MKRTSAIIRTDESAEAGRVFTELSKLAEESDPSRTHAPETVVPATAGRTRRRMSSIVLTPTDSSSRSRHNFRHWAAWPHGQCPATATKPGDERGGRYEPGSECSNQKRSSTSRHLAVWAELHRPLKFTPNGPLFGGLR